MVSEDVSDEAHAYEWLFFDKSPLYETSKVTVRKQNESFSVHRNRALIYLPLSLRPPGCSKYINIRPYP